MIRALGKIPLNVALDSLGLALLVVAAFTFVAWAGFAAAGVACLLLSWRYGE